jgi:N-acetylmuramic acid 6-phosphate (MurNAc-6-P) etherase
LRRCPNAASTTANTSSRPTGTAGGSCLLSATSFESTFGTGQNTVRGTVPAGRAAANQATFTEGAPYTFDPGGAQIRSATSACTMTRPRLTVGIAASRCSSTGTATL